MSSSLSNDFSLPRDSYLSFDGLSIKEQIRKRLNETGVFTDAAFEGSNISAINDVIAMVFSLLLYNLNQTSNQGLFSEASIYENISRIVKLIDYKPLGHQTASLNFTMVAQNINAGTYVIPRYSNINVGGFKYCLSSDFGFQKTVNTTAEVIDLSSDNTLLYQGTYQEFPTYVAQGIANELLYLTINDRTVVDHQTLDVYVKPVGGKWEKWNKTQSLYLSNPTAKSYEVRFNEKQRYEIKFGNNINGRQLSSGDQVAVYYLASDGKNGEVGASVLNGKSMQLFTSPRFNQILADLEGSYITQTNLNNLQFSNSCGSTYYSAPETVSQIRENAPGIFRSQYSLTTANSYQSYIRSNFSNIVQDVQVMNNQDYLDSYIKYHCDLGLTQPHMESRALFNHTRFADSCSFNNIYCFVVPKTIGNTLGHLNNAQKSLIISTLKEEKTLTSDVIPMDPVYLAFDFALGDSNTTVLDDLDQTVIQIEKTGGSRRSDASIIADVNQVIQTYFGRATNKLGKIVNTAELTSQILGLEGVKAIYTTRPDIGLTVNGLRLVTWNPIYPDVSFETVVGNKQLELFQFAYSFTTDFTSRIIIQ